MGVPESVSGSLRFPRLSAKARGECQHALAAPALGLRQLERAARGRRHRLWERRGVDVGARRLDQVLDEIGPAGHECAERAEGLAERADEHRHLLGTEAKVLEYAASARAHDTEAVRVVDHEPRILRACDARQLRQRRQIPVHAEHAVGGDERRALAVGAEQRRGGLRIPNDPSQRDGTILDHRAAERKAPP